MAAAPAAGARTVEKRNRTVLAAVALAAVFAVAVGVVLSTRASGSVSLKVRDYSAKQADNDMESYFDNLPGNKKAHAHHKSHHKAHHDHAEKKANGLKGGLKAKHDLIAKQIATKFDSDGLPVAATKKMSEADQKTDAEHKRNEDELKNYKMENPEFRKKMDKVHTKWMKKHDGLPKSKAEKKEYAALVNKEVGNIGNIVDSAMTTYPPGMNAEKMAKMQSEFFKTHADRTVVGKIPTESRSRHP